LKKLKT